MDVTWIASYPKSGNAWIRFLLAAYFFEDNPGGEGVDDFVVDFPTLYDQAQKAGDSDETLWQRLLEFGQHLPKYPPGFPGDLFLRTYQAATPCHPFLDRTKRAVVVARNPRDIALSTINYLRLMGKRVIDDERAYLLRFARYGGDPTWKRYGYGTWQDHTRSWLGENPFPVLLIRYEDLHADVVGECERLLRFLDIPVDHERMVRATEFAALQNSRKLKEERRRRGADGPVRVTESFMNRGRIRNTLTDVGPDLDERFEKGFQQGLKQLGYAA